MLARGELEPKAQMTRVSGIPLQEPRSRGMVPPRSRPGADPAREQRRPRRGSRRKRTRARQERTQDWGLARKVGAGWQGRGSAACPCNTEARLASATFASKKEQVSHSDDAWWSRDNQAASRPFPPLTQWVSASRLRPERAAQPLSTVLKNSRFGAVKIRTNVNPGAQVTT